MNFDITSKDPNSIVAAVTVAKGSNGSLTVRALCKNREKYLELKKMLGVAPYYTDEGLFFKSSSVCSVSLKSNDERLLKFFIFKLLQISPSLNGLSDSLKNNFDMDITVGRYIDEYEIPAWSLVDDRPAHQSYLVRIVQLKCQLINRKVSFINLTFGAENKSDDLDSMCIHFASADIADQFHQILCNLDKEYWSKKPMFINFFLHSAERTEENKSRLSQLMTCLVRFDEAVDSQLIGLINNHLKPVDRIAISPLPALRFQSGSSSSGQPTLSAQIDAVKNSIIELKKVLDEIADMILAKEGSEQAFDKDLENCCEHIVDLMREDKVFSAKLFELYAFAIRNKHDLKYILAKRRFQHHFLFTPGPDYYPRNLKILSQLFDELRKKEVKIPVTNGVNTDTVETLRNFLLTVEATDPKIKKYVYLALMILSKYWPINLEDYITYEAVAPNNRVFIQTGHQYDLPALMSYHKDRDRHQSDPLYGDRAFLQPNLNAPFDEVNTEHIMSVYTGSYYTTNDSHPLECLYDLQFMKRANEIKARFANAYTYWRESEKYSIIRFARLPLAQQEQLINLITGKEENGMNFELALVQIVEAGISLEEFASFDYEKQWALCYVRSEIPSPNIPELNFQALVKLKPDDIKSILEVYEDIKHKNDSTEILNQAIIELYLHEQREDQMNRPSSFAGGGIKSPFRK